MKSCLIVVSGPSGSGKTTLIREFLRQQREAGRQKYHLTVSCTTRKPRPNEVDGEAYHFVTHEQFRDMVEAGDFAEYAEVFGNYYGTLRREINPFLKKGIHVISDIDYKGARILRGQYRPSQEFQYIDFFIVVSEDEQLRRLGDRNTETLEQITLRMKVAKEEEMKVQHEFSEWIENDNLQHAVARLAFQFELLAGISSYPL